MRALLDLSTLDAISRAGLSVLLDATLKGTLVLAAASLLCLLLRRASAATRHLLLCVALGQVALLPLLSLALPGWQLPILLPRELAVIQTAPPSRPLPGEEAPPSSPAATQAQPGTLAAAPPSSPTPTMGSSTPSAAGPGAARSVPPDREPLAAPPPLPRGLMGLLLVWAAGVLLVTAPLLAGALSLRRIARGSPPPAEASWTALLHRLTAELGLRRPVTLRESPQVSVPMTWGILHPLVLLPTHSHDWSPERRRLVLLHELAHIQRADCLTQLLAQLVCALYWFNPLTWLAARQLRVERERASDDRVLAGGVKASAYAEHLLEIARLARGANCASLAAVAMARPSQLEGRLLAVLDAGRSRRAVSRLAVLVAVVAGSAAVLPLAALEAAARGGPSGKSAPLVAQGRAAGVVARQVWAGRGVNEAGAPSPDGRYLSFVEWDTTPDLAIRDLTTGKNRRLTRNGSSYSTSSGYPWSSIFSPDGRQVAYAWLPWSEEYCDLRLIGRDGSRQRVLYRNENIGWLQPVGWSPDGKQILVLLSSKRDRTNPQMVMISVADGSVRVLKTLDRDMPMRVSLSPDGRTIAYDYPTRADASQRDIFLLATDGSRDAPLVQHPANDRAPLWAPDGRKILFLSDRTGGLSLWAVPVANGQAQGAPELVKRDMGPMRPLGLTRGGSLFYAAQAGFVDVYTATLDPATGKLLASPQPVNPRLVGSNSFPAWSPDGRYLAYLSPGQNSLGAGEESRTVSIRSVEGGQTRELSLQLERIWRPSWSPDKRSLVAVGNDREGRFGGFQIDAQSGAVTFIPVTGNRGGPLWARDGKSIFYAGPSAIKVRDLATGRERDLHRVTGGLYKLALSSDGRQLAFATSDKQWQGVALHILPTAGGEPRELLRVKKDPYDIATIAWTSDGHHLLYGVKEATETELWRIPAAGGEPQRLGLAMEGLRDLSVHPDGHRIAFTGGSAKSEIWVLENFLPAAQTARAPAPQQ
jgi:Tol biopolymer transport system component/beta-lactamase regulating signal transducer with metallopeptidase domain